MKFFANVPLLVIAGVLISQLAVCGAGPSQTKTQSVSTNTTTAGSGTEALYRSAAESADSKFHKITINALKAQPDQTPTVFTEREINAYVAGGYVKLPQGVNRVQFSGTQSAITTNASIDFDKVTKGKTSSNPVMGMFSGVHEVQVVSHGQGVGGEANVHIDTVSIDGVGVPRIALEYFVDHYIKPKYPDLGLDSRFELPDRIDTAIVRDHVLTVTQK